MRTPPVREASTKPSAATVLPAPGGVLEPEAPGGVGVVGLLLELSLLALVLPVLRLDVLGLVLVEVDVDVFVVVSPPAPASAARMPPSASARRRCRARARSASARGPVAVPVGAPLGLGEQGGQGARQRVDLVGGEHRAVDEVGLLLGEQPLEASSSEKLRRHSIDGCLAS